MFKDEQNIITFVNVQIFVLGDFFLTISFSLVSKLSLFNLHFCLFYSFFFLEFIEIVTDFNLHSLDFFIILVKLHSFISILDIYFWTILKYFFLSYQRVIVKFNP